MEIGKLQLTKVFCVILIDDKICKFYCSKHKRLCSSLQFYDTSFESRGNIVYCFGLCIRPFVRLSFPPQVFLQDNKVCFPWKRGYHDKTVW